jgi:hypothetical protein
MKPIVLHGLAFIFQLTTAPEGSQAHFGRLPPAPGAMKVWLMGSFHLRFFS